MKLFTNAIKYNHKSNKNMTQGNLSTMLYAFNPRQQLLDEDTNVFFNLNKIIKPEKVIKHKKIKGEDYIIVHPDIEELAEEFGINLKTKKLIIYPNNSYNWQIKDYIEMYRTALEKLLKEIKIFQLNRSNYLNCFENFPLPSFLKFEQNEISKIIYLLQTINEQPEITITDYKFVSKRKKETYTKNINCFYNYKELKNQFEILIEDKTEYIFSTKKLENLKEKLKTFTCGNHPLSHSIFETSKLLTEMTINTIENNIEKLNQSEYFCLEYFESIVCDLYEYIGKENSIDKFVNKILNNKLSNIKVSKGKIKKIYK